MGYSPWGRKESNTAEQLTLLLFQFLSNLKAAEKFYPTGVVLPTAGRVTLQTTG